MENEEPSLIALLFDCYFFSEVLAVKEISLRKKIKKEADKWNLSMKLF